MEDKDLELYNTLLRINLYVEDPIKRSMILYKVLKKHIENTSPILSDLRVNYERVPKV